MSRVGRRPIDIPDGVKVQIEGRKVKVEAKGKTLEHEIPEGFKVEVSDKTIVIGRPSDSRLRSALAPRRGR